MAFHPDEVLFSPTTKCNLTCPHCDIKRSNTVLSIKAAKRFLLSCKKIGINRVGFTGGEPFLSGNFLYSIVKFAVSEGLLFSRIVTNGVWYKKRRDLEESLKRLFDAGYDGSIAVSVDAYHKQDLRKLALFIERATSIWRRPDMVSILYVTGRDKKTKEKLSKLAKLLGERLSGFGGKYPVIKSLGNGRAGLNLPYHINIIKIDMSPIGKARKLKDPWDGRWFKDDMCKGPGNVLFVEPSGDVKPCCGYASELPELTIGNIKRNSAFWIIKNIRQNPIVYDIFNSGLGRIRRRLADRGVIFPGKTSNNCFFCHYILTKEMYR